MASDADGLPGGGEKMPQHTYAVNDANDKDKDGASDSSLMMTHDELPEGFRDHRPVSGSWKLLCGLYLLLMTQLGFTIKLIGYTKENLTVNQKSFSLYTSFIQVAGIGCLVGLTVVFFKQTKSIEGFRPYDPHNGSLYLKAGLVVFTVATVFYNVTEMVEDVMLFWTTAACGSVQYTLYHAISLVFNLCTCLFVCLYSKAAFMRWPRASMLLLTHLICVCLHSWFSLVIDEFAESLHFKEKVIEAMKEEIPDDTATECAEYMEQSSVVAFSETSSKFLFPCSIEMYLIAGGFFAIMAMNVSRPHVIRDSSGQVVYGGHHKRDWNSRLFFEATWPGCAVGVFAMLFTVGVVVGKLLAPTDQAGTFAVIFHWLQFIINIVLFVSLAVCYRELRKRHLEAEFHNRIDVPLLFVGLTGICFYSYFSIAAGLYGIHGGENLDLSASTMCAYLSHVVQCVTQTVFLLDTLRRKAGRPDSLTRNILFFAMLGNISLWLMQMFELDFENVNPVQVRFFGHTNWTLITHISGPLAIFYRFHSTACLFDVWHVGFLRPHHPDTSHGVTLQLQHAIPE